MQPPKNNNIFVLEGGSDTPGFPSSAPGVFMPCLSLYFLLYGAGFLPYAVHLAFNPFDRKNDKLIINIIKTIFDMATDDNNRSSEQLFSKQILGFISYGVYAIISILKI